MSFTSVVDTSSPATGGKFRQQVTTVYRFTKFRRQAATLYRAMWERISRSRARAIRSGYSTEVGIGALPNR